MKYANIFLIFLLILYFNHCSNNNDTNQAVCEPPIIDSTIHEFSTNCRASEEEHLRLEGITLTDGQTIELWFKSDDISGTRGIKITIDDMTTNNVTVHNASAIKQGTASVFSNIICFDFHNETALHAVSWQGSECNASGKIEGNLGTTLINEESNLGNYTTGAVGNKMLYRITEGAVVRKIQSKDALVEESE